MTTPRKRRRPTWQDPRRIRRLAVILLMAQGEALTERYAAAHLDRVAALNEQEPEEWMRALAAAEYYLRELGRTRT